MTKTNIGYSLDRMNAAAQQSGQLSLLDALSKTYRQSKFRTFDHKADVLAGTIDEYVGNLSGSDLAQAQREIGVFATLLDRQYSKLGDSDRKTNAMDLIGRLREQATPQGPFPINDYREPQAAVAVRTGTDDAPVDAIAQNRTLALAKENPYTVYATAGSDGTSNVTPGTGSGASGSQQGSQPVASASGTLRDNDTPIDEPIDTYADGTTSNDAQPSRRRIWPGIATAAGVITALGVLGHGATNNWWQEKTPNPQPVAGDYDANGTAEVHADFGTFQRDYNLFSANPDQHADLKLRLDMTGDNVVDNDDVVAMRTLYEGQEWNIENVPDELRRPIEGIEGAYTATNPITGMAVRFDPAIKVVADNDNGVPIIGEDELGRSQTGDSVQFESSSVPVTDETRRLDFDGDGELTEFDIPAFGSQVHSYLSNPGAFNFTNINALDFNTDGRVNLADITAFAQQMGDANPATLPMVRSITDPTYVAALDRSQATVSRERAGLSILANGFNAAVQEELGDTRSVYAITLQRVNNFKEGACVRIDPETGRSSPTGIPYEVVAVVSAYVPTVNVDTCGDLETAIFSSAIADASNLYREHIGHAVTVRDDAAERALAHGTLTGQHVRTLETQLGLGQTLDQAITYLTTLSDGAIRAETTFAEQPTSIFNATPAHPVFSHRALNGETKQFTMLGSLPTWLQIVEDSQGMRFEICGDSNE